MMRFGIRYKQRDILLIPIPFTDLKSIRKRPVVVISNDSYNDKTDDIIVVGLTSNITSKEFSILISNDDLEEGTLKYQSQIRVDRIYSISQSIVVKRFGKLNKETFEKIINILQKLIKQ
ncbi:MAG: type II toxin-antitoxin system PemK/MazF family toxin [Methanosarcinales archaeon]